MAADRLQIRLDAVDNTKRAFGSIKNSIFNLRNALASLGVGLVIKQFVDTGRQVERLGVRFKFLFGTAEEGKKAFDTLVKFASRVPFSLEEIQSASGNLAVVSKDADELSKMLKITGNVAAVTGLDFRTTAEQIQRSFSAGIGAADLFRDRGVRAMLGFKAGATVSIEETQKRFEELFGEGGRFGNATDEFARTFDGTISMIGDKLFKFKKDVADAGFFEAFRTEIEVLDKALIDNEKTLQQLAKTIGKTLASAVHGLGDAIRFLSQYADEMILVFQTFILLSLASVIAKITAAFYALAASINTARIALEGLNFAAIRNRFLQIAIAIFTLGKGLKELQKRFGETFPLFDEDEIEGAAVDVKSILDPIKAKEAMNLLERIAYEIKEVFKEIDAATVSKGVIDILKKDFESVNKTISQGIAKGIKTMSRSLAESIVLGKNLNDVLRNLAQTILINIISKTIEFIALKTLEYFYERLITQKNAEKENLIRKQNTNLKRQIALQAILAAFGGGGGGFGFAEGGQVKARADGGGVGRGSPYMVGERGRELFIPNQDGEIVSNERLQNLGATVNFTINATDVKGVKELLIDNRATIVNIINGALNQKGKAALV